MKALAVFAGIFAVPYAIWGALEGGSYLLLLLFKAAPWLSPDMVLWGLIWSVIAAFITALAFDDGDGL